MPNIFGFMKPIFYVCFIKLYSMKFILKLTLLLFILASCKKEKDSSDTSDNTKLLEKFDASFVKEWYYSVFKKSNEWKGSGGKQLPYWPKGIYKKVGNLEIVEFPLMKKSKDISIPADGLEDYNKIRIAEASLQRVAFIRDKKGNIYVREIDYIPEWSYLQQNKFDISNPENMDVKANFRGRKIVKDWGNKTLVLLRLHNGKVTGRGIPKSNTLNRTETCSTIRYCIWQQDCELEFVGDVVSLDCSEWYNTHECWDETVCTGGGEDDCEDLGVNCEEPGEGGEECDPTLVSPEEEEFNSYVMMVSSAETYESPVTSPSTTAHINTYTWDVVKAAVGGWAVKSTANYSYIHYREINPTTNTLESNFNISLYTSGPGFFVGSNTFITSTYSQVTPTTNQIVSNNTSSAHGESTVVGTITHKIGTGIIGDLPFCPKEINRTDQVNGSIKIYPR